VTDNANQQVEQLSEHLRVAVDPDGTFRYYVDLDGVGRIQIRKLNHLLFLRWLKARQISRPKPPLVKIKLGTREHWQPNAEDEFYKAEKALYEQNENTETMEYMLRHGAYLKPPDDWQLPNDFERDYLFSDDERGLAWLYAMTDGNEVVEKLVDAIQSLMSASEEEIQAHLASFKSDGEQ